MISRTDLIYLIVLAALWGGSFIFQRVLSPVLGPVLTAFFRVAIAGVALLIYFQVIKFDIEWKKNWKHYFVIGVVNSGIPFLLFSYAALYIPASLSAILNSSAPMFGALFAAIWLGDKLTPIKTIGLILGSVGVTFVALKGTEHLSSEITIAIIGCLAASAGYGLAGVYTKKFAKDAKPYGIAAASQITAALAIAPIIPFSPIRGEIDGIVIANVLGLSLLCSSVAYLFYFRLVQNIGPTKALTVTYLVPLFGMTWASLFLHEVITGRMIVGCLLIIGGTVLVLRKK
jgi:drug/metabolite transporter (DMT)-like permease